MSKGPYFEFNISRDDNNSIIFIFNKGNTSDYVFNSTKNAMVTVFKNRYQDNYSDYIFPMKLKDSTETIGIYQTKVLSVINAILTTQEFYNFKVKLVGVDSNFNPKTVVLTNWIEDKDEAKSVIPYFNKNNNDMTTYGDHQRKHSNC